jgi:hypothetical protein
MVSERDIVAAIADQSGVASAVDDDLVPSTEALTHLPFEVAQDNSWLPLRVRGKILDLAVNTVPSRREINMIESLSRLRVEPHVVERARLEAAIARAYRFGDDARAKPIGVYLVDAGFIDRATLDAFLAKPDPAGRRLLERIVDDELLDDEALTRVVSNYFDVKVHGEDLHATIADDKTLVAAQDLLHAHPGLVLVEHAGALTQLSAIPMDSSVVGAVHARFGPASSMVATRSHVRALRESTDRRLEQLALAG